MMRNDFTIDEIISSLKHSSLPTILVEGKDDMFIYRWIEDVLGNRKINFQNCGGRNTLLKIFERKNEFPNLKVLFIADKDLWIFTGIPPEYNSEQLFTTYGYSIENDIYINGKNLLKSFLSINEQKSSEIILQNLIEWYAFEIQMYLEGKKTELNFDTVSLLNTKKFDQERNEFTDEFLIECRFFKPTESILNNIITNYETHLRGKFIIDVFLKTFTNRKDKLDTRYSRKEILDICFRCALSIENSLINNMIRDIQNKIVKNP